MQAVELPVVDGDKPHCFQALHFTAVVHNVSPNSIMFRFLDNSSSALLICGNYPEAEAGTFVYFHFLPYCSFLRYDLHTFSNCSASHSFCWGNGHVAVVEQQCVVGFAGGPHFPRSGLYNPSASHSPGFRRNRLLLSFGFQFIVSALCTDFGRGSYEYLKFGIRKYGSADVATVHDNAFGFAHFRCWATIASRTKSRAAMGLTREDTSIVRIFFSTLMPFR